MIRRVSGISLLIFIFAAPMAPAGVIVNWGGNYIPPPSLDLQGKNSFFDNTGIDADNDMSADDSIGGRLFSQSTAMNPGGAYGGTSGTFYGGAITAHRDDTATAEFDNFRIQNQGPNDRVQVSASSHGHFHDLRYAMYWDSADFLGTGGVPSFFDAGSSATIDLGTGGTENTTGSEVRLLVRDAMGDFWLSQTAFISPTSTNHDFTWDSGNQGFSATSDGNWAAYDPTSAFPGTGGTAGSDLRFDQSVMFSPKKFTEITGIGFLLEQDTFHNNISFHIESFAANAATVPEPSMLMFATAAMSGMGLYVRRRRKKETESLPETDAGA